MHNIFWMKINRDNGKPKNWTCFLFARTPPQKKFDVLFQKSLCWVPCRFLGLGDVFNPKPPRMRRVVALRKSPQVRCPCGGNCRSFARTGLWRGIAGANGAEGSDEAQTGRYTPLKINGWNLKITRLKRKIIWTKTSILGFHVSVSKNSGTPNHPF